jgi:hypothetical protein
MKRRGRIKGIEGRVERAKEIFFFSKKKQPDFEPNIENGIPRCKHLPSLEIKIITSGGKIFFQPCG